MGEINWQWVRMSSKHQPTFQLQNWTMDWTTSNQQPRIKAIADDVVLKTTINCQRRSFWQLTRPWQRRANTGITDKLHKCRVSICFNGVFHFHFQEKRVSRITPFSRWINGILYLQGCLLFSPIQYVIEILNISSAILSAEHINLHKLVIFILSAAHSLLQCVTWWKRC